MRDTVNLLCVTLLLSGTIGLILLFGNLFNFGPNALHLAPQLALDDESSESGIPAYLVQR
jgi:hypothetical protein